LYRNGRGKYVLQDDGGCSGAGLAATSVTVTTSDWSHDFAFHTIDVSSFTLAASTAPPSTKHSQDYLDDSEVSDNEDHEGSFLDSVDKVDTKDELEENVTEGENI
jgi:hypothetical protein